MLNQVLKISLPMELALPDLPDQAKLFTQTFFREQKVFFGQHLQQSSVSKRPPPPPSTIYERIKMFIGDATKLGR